LKIENYGREGGGIEGERERLQDFLTTGKLDLKKTRLFDY